MTGGFLQQNMKPQEKQDQQSSSLFVSKRFHHKASKFINKED